MKNEKRSMKLTISIYFKQFTIEPIQQNKRLTAIAMLAIPTNLDIYIILSHLML
jgi:hypothetical protein